MTSITLLSRWRCKTSSLTVCQAPSFNSISQSENLNPHIPMIFISSVSDNCGSSNVLVGTAPVNLTSPGYPGAYPHSVYCKWEIRAPDWLYVVVSIQDFYESHDFVSIIGTSLDGHTASFDLTMFTQIKSIAFNSSTGLSISFRDRLFPSIFLLQLQGTNGNTTDCNRNITIYLSKKFIVWEFILDAIISNR